MMVLPLLLIMVLPRMLNDPETRKVIKMFSCDDRLMLSLCMPSEVVLFN